MDSTLYTYYRWCNDHIRFPDMMLKTVTMFRMAVEKYDSRMQCIALTFKADHYYFTNNLDSLKGRKPRVQAFARQQEQPNYDYFIWTRLILYYTQPALTYNACQRRPVHGKKAR